MWFRSYCRDRVEWGEEQERVARSKVEENSIQKLPDHMSGKVEIKGWVLEYIMCCRPCIEAYEVKAAEHWDAFYHQHQNKLMVKG